MKKRIKTLCLVLAFAILAGLLPALDLSAFATGNSAACASFAEFKAAMEDPSVSNVTVKGFIEDIVGSGDAINVSCSSGRKILELDGDVVLGQQNRNSGYENLIRVGAGVKLTVTGKGGIHWNPSYTSGRNAMFLLDVGDLCFDEDFTGQCESKDLLSGVFGPIVDVNYGHLLVKNGIFTVRDTDVTDVRGVIETASSENTVVALLGGSFSASSNKKGSYVIVNNCDHLMLHNIEYSTTSGLMSKADAEVSIRDYADFVTWEPFKKAYLPNFPMADLGEKAELSFQYHQSNSMKNKMLGGFLKYVELQEVTGNTRTSVATFESSKVTHRLSAMNQPTVKNYKIVFCYGYDYGGEWHDFYIERDLRAEWKDLSYNGEGTEASPVRAGTFEELRRALYDENVEYVELSADVEEELDYLSYDWDGADPYGWKMKYWQGKISAEELYQNLSRIDVTDNLYAHDGYLGVRDLNTCALNVQGKKHLILSHDLTLTADSFPYDAQDSGFMRGIQMNSDLTVSGGGTFDVTLTSPNFGNAATAIMNDMGYLLTVEDAKIIAKTQQYAGYARAIMTCGSDLIINGGEFRGQQLNEGKPYTDLFTDAGVVSVDSESRAEINGGIFTEVQLGETGTCLLPGLLIDEEALKRVTLNGGVFQPGIMYKTNQGIKLIEDEKLYKLLKVGASYKTEKSTVSGVSCTTHTVTASTVVIPEGAGETPENPVFCDSYFKFKYAMEHPDVLYVALSNVDDMMPRIPHDEEKEPDGVDNVDPIVVRGKKDLNLLGDAVFSAPISNNYDLKCFKELLVLSDVHGADLYIHGPGSLTFNSGYLDFYYSAIKVIGGKLCIDGATVCGSHGNHTGFSYGINALYGQLTVQGGATVYGGVYKGEGVCALSLGDEALNGSLSVNVFDGNFYVKRSVQDGNVDHGIWVNQKDVGLRIYGARTDGFKLWREAQGHTLADFVQDGSVMTVEGTKVNPAYYGTVNGKILEIYREIDSAELHINSPVAGKDIPIYAENVYNAPEGSAVKCVTWLEDGKTPVSSQFIAGKSYKVEITVEAEEGVRFASPMATATVNFKKATVRDQSIGDVNAILLSYDFGKCPATVGEVDLTIDAPKQNGKPDQYVTCASSTYKQALAGTNMFDAPLQWQESSDGKTWEVMKSADTFTVGYCYRVFIDLTPASGYLFALDPQLEPNVTATVNGSVAKVNRYPEEDPEKLISVCFEFGVLNDTVIEQIDIDGVTEPVVGEKPDYSCAVSGIGYHTNSNYDDAYEEGVIQNGLGWWDYTADNWVKPTDAFQIGHEYKVVVYVSTDSGYEFYTDAKYGQPKGWGYINGNYATFGRQSLAANDQTLSWVFTCQPKTVKAVAVESLQAPVAGAKPDFTANTDHEFYGVESIEWYDYTSGADMTSYDTFVEGHEYWLSITIVPGEKDGKRLCKFLQDKTVASLNGVQVQPIKGYSWHGVESGARFVIIRYTFKNTPASGETFSVGGSVTAKEGSADGTTVQLLSSANGEVLYQTTVSGGKYSISGVAMGFYTVRFAKDGFATRESVIGIYDNVTLNMEMVKESSYLKGDVDNDGDVDMDDAIYLLFHVNFQDSYPVNQPANFDGLGEVTMDDAIYLLFHVNFQDSYPLH